MWIENNQYYNNKSINIIAGKVLILCQKFETEAKAIVPWLMMADNLNNDNYSLFSEKHKKHLDSFVALSLSGNLKKLDKLSDKHKKEFRAELDILESARESRNYLIHNGFLDFVYKSKLGNEYIYRESSPLLEHLIALAKGTFIITSWAYSFHEREAQGHRFMNDYVEELLAWIFDEG
jgi:hypothetical protein